jgi:hypothetical protein
MQKIVLQETHADGTMALSRPSAVSVMLFCFNSVHSPPFLVSTLYVCTDPSAVTTMRATPWLGVLMERKKKILNVVSWCKIAHHKAYVNKAQILGLLLVGIRTRAKSRSGSNICETISGRYEVTIETF